MNAKSQIQEQLNETWNRTREIIRSENELINQRLSWMFAAQTFLFAAFAFGVNVVIESTHWGNRILVMFYLFIAIVLGLFSSLTAFRMARDANKQREFAADYWKRRSSALLSLTQDKDPNASPEKGNSGEDKKFEEKIFDEGFPERVHGKDFKTECFGFLQRLPVAERFTRDHTFPKMMAYAWLVVLVLWLVLWLL